MHRRILQVLLFKINKKKLKNIYSTDILNHTLLEKCALRGEHLTTGDRRRFKTLVNYGKCDT